MFLMCASGKHPIQITGKHIDLDIKLLSDLEFAKRRVVRCVRDYVDRKAVWSNLIHRQRYTVESD